MGIEGHADISGIVDVRLPHIGHQYTWTELLRFHFAVKLLDKRLRMLQHPCPWLLKNPPILLDGQVGVNFHTEVIVLDLLFQRNVRKVVIVIADAEFFPLLHAIDLFPQRLVFVIIKVDASYRIKPIRTRMRIALHDSSEPLSECVVVGRVDLIFQFMPIAYGKLHCHTPFCFLL